MCENNLTGSFSSLLPEILLRILELLSLKDLLSCCQVCCQWFHAATDNLLWYKRCTKQGITDGLCAENEPGYWKECYMSYTRSCLKWRGLSEEPPVIVSMRCYAVITDLIIHHNWAACSLDNGVIIVIDILSQTKKHTFPLYDKGAIWALVAFTNNNEDFLASGGNDGIIRIWNIASGNLDAELETVVNETLLDHDRIVRCLTVSAVESNDGSLRLVSGGRNYLIHIWDVITKTRVHLLRGHSGAIRCVKANKTIVVSASYDCSIIVWHIITGERIHSLIGHNNRVYSLYLSHHLIISSSLDTTMKVWNIVTGECIHSLEGHASLTKAMVMDKDESLIISGNADMTMRRWAPNSGECVFVVTYDYEGTHGHAYMDQWHSAAITSVHIIRNEFIVSSAADGYVKLWSLHDGSFIRNILSLENSADNVTVWQTVATDTHLLCATGSPIASLPSKLYLFNFSLDPPFHVEITR